MYSLLGFGLEIGHKLSVRPGSCCFGIGVVPDR